MHDLQDYIWQYAWLLFFPILVLDYDLLSLLIEVDISISFFFFPFYEWRWNPKKRLKSDIDGRSF